ncbi:Csu type fimbrial protein [Pragia fontium]|uniref:Spore coat protein U (SCPU) domain-containing protein n=1 Tax=Pragia fontium DSM 5563 = ATCC 49100 TaxID=1122977 RepID=A0AAJ4WAR2_9GAMM|nr:spore coat U domain-containing protein [Pragia fontium]SFC87129.1 Spore coat protein U (SCPU) domain-containing protein [Pragia fontium DSM 5563 = ATCC 49100]SUB83187.1 Uncharacterized secreted protein [Pragia fontium]VEJ56082.1 Uncharacterized secreted protein [Pragia fontium]
MKKIFITLACITSVISATNVFAAGSVSGSLGVQLTVTNGCAINGDAASTGSANIGTLNFGSTSSLATAITGTSAGATSGAIKVQCTNTLPYSVDLDNGVNADGASQRRLKQGTEYVTYNLYKDSNRSTPWESGTPLTKTSTGAPDDLIVYGQVPPQSTPSAGTYADTVLVTVSW